MGYRKSRTVSAKEHCSFFLAMQTATVIEGAECFNGTVFWKGSETGLLDS
jgi:hypothetical protein